MKVHSDAFLEALIVVIVIIVIIVIIALIVIIVTIVIIVNIEPLLLHLATLPKCPERSQAKERCVVNVQPLDFERHGGLMHVGATGAEKEQRSRNF